MTMRTCTSVPGAAGGKHIPGDGCSIHGDGSDSLFYVVRILHSDAIDCTAVAALDGIVCPFRGDTGIDGKALQRGLHAENGLRDADERPGCRAGEPAVLALAEGGLVQNGPVARLAEVGVRSGNEPQRVVVKAAAHSQVALLGQGLVLVIGAAVGELGGGNVQDAFPRPLGDHVDEAQQVLTGVTEAHAPAHAAFEVAGGTAHVEGDHALVLVPDVYHAVQLLVAGGHLIAVQQPAPMVPQGGKRPVKGCVGAVALHHGVGLFLVDDAGALHLASSGFSM